MKVSTYFDVEDFVHKVLFNGSQYPWEPLELLPEYLSIYTGSDAVSVSLEGIFLKNPETIFLGKNVILEPGVYIQGPCIIGDDCEIRHGAYIRGNVILGNRCVVGHASEVKSSILLNDAKVPHFNYCGDSILGNRTNMGAGAITANVRFDKKPIHVRLEGKKINSGRVKMGLVLGDDSQIGCNVVTQPGTIYPKRTLIPPYLHIKRRILHDCESTKAFCP